MTSRVPQSSRLAFEKIREIIRGGEVPFSEGLNGSAAPGNTLEHLLQLEINNNDSPDLMDWEVKFHGGSSLLTLFHKEPSPRGIMDTVVDTFGWDDGQGRVSFRHTIRGVSPRGFQIVNRDNRITVLNTNDATIAPYWDHNIILGAISAKLRRLIVVHGIVNKTNRTVRYNRADAYWDLDVLGICNSIQGGTILIDFDARTTGARGTSLRNHGTKFRIDIENVGAIYENHQIII